MNFFKIKILFTLLLSFYSFKISSQDIHFSQFWDPLAITSPTLIGNFDGNIKAEIQFRNQWSQFPSALNTAFADITYKKMNKNLDYWAFGVSILNDKMKYLSYNQNRLYLSVSYQKRFSKVIQGGIGVQGGFRLTSLDYSTLTYDKQWDPNTGVFSPALPSFEDFSYNNLMTPFMTIGGSVNIIKPKILHTIDASAMYIGKNESQASDFVFYQPFKFSFNYHSYWQIRPKITLMPKLGTFYTANINCINLGLLAKFNTHETDYIYGGVLYRWGIDRNSDAFIPVIGYKIKSIKIGLSYDFTTSGINQEAFKNAYEISVVYIAKFKKNKYYSIDCLRL